MKPLVRPDKTIATFQIPLEVNHIPSPAQTPFVNCLEHKFLGTHIIHCPFSGWAPGVLLWGEQVLKLNIRRTKGKIGIKGHLSSEKKRFFLTQDWVEANISQNPRGEARGRPKSPTVRQEGGSSLLSAPGEVGQMAVVTEYDCPQRRQTLSWPL